MRSLGALVLGLVIAGPPAAALACTPLPAEQRSWDRASREDDPALYLAHLRDFPTGCRRDAAIARLESLIPDAPELTVQASMPYDNVTPGGNGDVVGGGNTYLVQFRLNSPAVPLAYMCDSLVHGRDEAVRWDRYCPHATAPFQRLGVSILEPLRAFYTLEVSCGTVELPSQIHRTYRADATGWCGPSRSDWNYTSMAIDWLSVTVRRADFRKPAN